MDKAKRNDIHRRFVYLSSDDVSRKRSFACSVLMGRFHELAMMVEECTRDCREKSLALTALEEASMWAMKAVMFEGPREKLADAAQGAPAGAAAPASADMFANAEMPKVEITPEQVARSLADAIKDRGRIFEMGA